MTIHANIRNLGQIIDKSIESIRIVGGIRTPVPKVAVSCVDPSQPGNCDKMQIRSHEDILYRRRSLFAKHL